MKKYPILTYFILLMILFCVSNFSFAQEVSNISFKQEGSQVVISYDLAGNEGDLFNTTAYYSIDDGKTWTKLVTVTGDLLRVGPGTGKTIYWEVLKDVTGIKGSISFKVDALKSKESVGDNKGFFIAGEILGVKLGIIGNKWGINGTFFINGRGTVKVDTTKNTSRRIAAYVSVTRKIKANNKLKWNLGPSLGFAQSYIYDSYYDDTFSPLIGPAIGLTNEFQFKNRFLNIDLLLSPFEEMISPLRVTVGFGIVF
jgi:hypothetical protein